MAIEYKPGRIYLRDKRNGNVYEYERNLADKDFIEEFEPLPTNAKGKPVKSAAVPEAPKPTMPVLPEPPKPGVVEPVHNVFDVTEANRTASQQATQIAAVAQAEGVPQYPPAEPVTADAASPVATRVAVAAADPAPKPPVPKPPVPKPAPHRAVRAPAKPAPKKAVAKKPNKR